MVGYRGPCSYVRAEPKLLEAPRPARPPRRDPLLREPNDKHWAESEAKPLNGFSPIFTGLGRFLLLCFGWVEHGFYRFSLIYLFPPGLWGSRL